MNLYNENMSSSEVNELFEIKNRFLQNNNIDTSYYILMQDIIAFFDLDRIYIGMKSVLTNECVPIVEYLKGKEPNFLGDVVDFTSYTKFVNMSTNENEEAYINFCDKNNYIQGNDFNETSRILSRLGYVKSSKGIPDECLLFYIRNKESFSFMTMERYEGRGETFSKTQLLALADIHYMLGMRIEKETLDERLYNEIHMKNIIIEHEDTPICIIEKENLEVLHFNDAYKRLMPNVEIGSNYFSLFEEENSPKLSENSESLVLQKDKNDMFRYWIRKVAPFTLADTTEVYIIYIKNAQEYIDELEGIDLLTSAYSVTGFAKCFEDFTNRNTVDDYALCTIDIAKFKYINDMFGFEVGNKILKKVAGKLNNFIDKQEAFCRMSEDRFAILLKFSTEDKIKRRIQKLFIDLDIMTFEFFPDIELKYMCGVTAVEKNIEMNSLIDRANIARKTVKGSHKSSVGFFDEKSRKKMENEINIESRTAKAIENNEFLAYLQPKFNLETMKISGAEALVRWLTPDGMIFPDQFIPLFEANGFILTLDFIVYEKVMKFIKKCLDENLPVYPISVNVSRNHINDKNFLTKFIKLINKYKVPREFLELEITESVFVEDKHTLIKFIDDIKAENLKISIDDFGTAYSSLQTLTDINVDILKIDKGFLDKIAVDDTTFDTQNSLTKNKILIKSVIALAKELDFKVICEGIESQGQIDFLKTIGCEFGQGYVFSKPLPIAEFKKHYL